MSPPYCPTCYHGERRLSLLEERLGQQGDVNALGDGDGAAVQVCDDDIQLRHTREGNFFFLNQFRIKYRFRVGVPVPAKEKTHQFLCLRAEKRIDADDKRSGSAEDFQEFTGQDGNVCEAMGERQI